MRGAVVAVSRSATHSFSKRVEARIRLIVGLGVYGDAHHGATVQHRSRIAKYGGTPNLRQVHLIHAELFQELRAAGFSILPGQMGENITTGGLDLLGLPTGARLQIGADAVIEITGLRNPCRQLNDFRPGLMAATLDRDADGNLIRKAGIMGIVVAGGEVSPGDPIEVRLPALPYRALEPV
jgi:MOSC domain-containing protein YiiM